MTFAPTLPPEAICEICLKTKGSFKGVYRGSLITRIGFGLYYTMMIVRTPPKKIVLLIM